MSIGQLNPAINKPPVAPTSGVDAPPPIDAKGGAPEAPTGGPTPGLERQPEQDTFKPSKK